MNNDRRKEISSIIEQAEELKDKLENILADRDCPECQKDTIESPQEIIEKNMIYEIKAKYIPITVDDFSFLCIFGKYESISEIPIIKSGFLAIPTWNMCCNLDDADNISYNSGTIFNYLVDIKELEKLPKEIIGNISYTIAEQIMNIGY